MDVRYMGKWVSDYSPYHSRWRFRNQSLMDPIPNGLNVMVSTESMVFVVWLQRQGLIEANIEVSDNLIINGTHHRLLGDPTLMI